MNAGNLFLLYVISFVGNLALSYGLCTMRPATDLGRLAKTMLLFIAAFDSGCFLMVLPFKIAPTYFMTIHGLGQWIANVFATGEFFGVLFLWTGLPLIWIGSLGVIITATLKGEPRSFMGWGLGAALGLFICNPLGNALLAWCVR